MHIIEENMSLSLSEGGRLPSSAPDWAVAASERIKSKRIAGKINSAMPPEGVKKVLLHSCCAPCSGAMVDEMRYSEMIDKVVVFFYNPNIHPRKEYLIRKEENKKYCKKIGVEFIDCEYDDKNWFKRMKGMEFDPERGHRCTECFDMRMERTGK